MNPRAKSRIPVVLVAAAVVVAVTAISPARASSGSHRPTVTSVTYDSATLTEYNQKWSNIYGPLDGAAESVANGAFTVSDVPFKPGTDFSVFDHLKYMAVSNQAFAAPANGAVTFSVDIAASTPGAVAGHVVHGQYGPPGSYDPANTTAQPYSAHTLEGQQAGVVLNMIDFCSGQLFDWFVSSHSAFALIERLPTSITANTSNPNCPGASLVDLSKAYTQIVRVVPIAAGVKHRVTITYGQGTLGNAVVYTIDGHIQAAVGNVGVPLDKQGVPYTGIYPSLGAGERLAGKISSFSIGHGLFSLLDAFPFQYGCSPPSASGPGACDPSSAQYSVSIPASQRSFGQGAVGTFSGFRVVTVTR